MFSRVVFRGRTLTGKVKLEYPIQTCCNNQNVAQDGLLRHISMGTQSISKTELYNSTQGYSG